MTQCTIDSYLHSAKTSQLFQPQSCHPGCRQVEETVVNWRERGCTSLYAIIKCGCSDSHTNVLWVVSCKV